MGCSINKAIMRVPGNVFRIWYLVLGLFVLGLGLRLFDLTDEPLDFHSTRQLRGAIVARGMYYEMLPNADEGLRNRALTFWQSVGQYEPSILERMTALTYLAVGKEVTWIAQLYSILFWMIGGMALYALSQQITIPSSSASDPADTPKSATQIPQFIALAYYMALPFGVQASRTIQPDPGMVMWIILYTYAIYRWSEERRAEWHSTQRESTKISWKWALLAGVFGGLATYAKAIAAYPIAGIAIALVLYTGITRTRSIKEVVKKIVLNPQVWVMAGMMILPTAIFYLGKGERIRDYLGGWSLEQLLVQPWFYAHWINTVRKLVGIIPLLLIPFSLWAAKPSIRALLLGWWTGYLVYGLFLPYQMYTHSYYHLQLVPLVSLSLLPGLQALIPCLLMYISPLGKTWRIATSVALILLGAAVLIYASWQATIPQRMRDSRNEPAHWQEIASRLPQDGKIVALTQDYGFRLMYYGWRKVTLWPNRGELKLSELRESEKEFETLFARNTEGKSYFLITSFRQFDDQPDLKAYLYDHYPITAEGDFYILFNLNSPLPPSSPAP